MTILKNVVECNTCGVALESKTTRALITCKCGRVCVSGGRKRLERYAKDGAYTEKSIIEVNGKKV